MCGELKYKFTYLLASFFLLIFVLKTMFPWFILTSCSWSPTDVRLLWNGQAPAGKPYGWTKASMGEQYDSRWKPTRRHEEKNISKAKRLFEPTLISYGSDSAVTVHPMLCSVVCAVCMPHSSQCQGNVVGDTLWIGQDFPIWGYHYLGRRRIATAPDVVEKTESEI